MSHFRSVKPVSGRWMTELAKELGYDPRDVVSMRVNKSKFVVVHRDAQGRMQITEFTIEKPEGQW